MKGAGALLKAKLGRAMSFLKAEEFGWSRVVLMILAN